jgi:Ca2+-binding EF-hand superfamily protein
MKHHCSLHTHGLRLLAGLPMIGLALAGGEPTPTDRFNTADADVSGALSSAEFATTFGSPLSKGQLKKEFRDADDDGNGSVILAEWLGYLRDEVLTDPSATPTEKFQVVDGDADGSITLEEFALLVPGKKALIEKRKRFLMADADDDDLVTLDEYLDYLDSPQPDTSGIPFRKFDLADLDGDGSLTIDEFANAYPPAVKPQVIAKKFTGKDADEDDLLTRDEWNPGGGSSGAPM